MGECAGYKGGGGMKFYTDGKARPFSSISINDEPLEMPDDCPQFYIPIYTSAEICTTRTGDERPIEVELHIEGGTQ